MTAVSRGEAEEMDLRNNQKKRRCQAKAQES